MHGIGRIPDEVGHLILSEDGAIITSGGDLENAEQFASSIMSLLTCTSRNHLMQSDGGGFKKISVTYTDHCYVICLSNKNIHIVKRRFATHEPVNV
ncbi:putative ragulator complex protein LAMTOR4-like isoform X1 [Penaeus vannamei]|uniref:Late endosomal/lysosomal adaptor and MAPK and MTOR activator 4 n=1 Tax=Penaeus vannamei TaxID=6689 RepID=A0A423TNT1_PENVA|nr:ragulator complex protein LAMTOR4-like [Penaeus vannamei]ROT78088.1 putative ragulator complex protein LAMTOR4-like isoform X1 [Penaeus vannamei]